MPTGKGKKEMRIKCGNTTSTIRPSLATCGVQILLRVRSRRTKAKEQQRKARVHVRQLGRKQILTALLVPATNRFRMYDDSKIKQLENTTASYA